MPHGRYGPRGCLRATAPYTRWARSLDFVSLEKMLLCSKFGCSVLSNPPRDSAKHSVRVCSSTRHSFFTAPAPHQRQRFPLRCLSLMGYQLAPGSLGNLKKASSCRALTFSELVCSDWNASCITSRRRSRKAVVPDRGCTVDMVYPPSFEMPAGDRLAAGDGQISGEAGVRDMWPDILLPQLLLQTAVCTRGSQVPAATIGGKHMLTQA